MNQVDDDEEEEATQREKWKKGKKLTERELWTMCAAVNVLKVLQQAADILLPQSTLTYDQIGYFFFFLPQMTSKLSRKK